MKLFISFTLYSDLFNFVMRIVVQMKDVTKRNRKESRTIYKLFWVLFALHIVVNSAITLLTAITLIYSDTLLDILNNSLSIMVLLNLH